MPLFNNSLDKMAVTDMIPVITAWVDLNKDTFYIVLIMAGFLALALVFNIVFIIAYTCKQTICTVKQKVFIILLNLGALFSLATDTYYKYYEHQQWGLGGHNNLHCKTIKFVGCFGFSCYVYTLVALASDSVIRLQRTVNLGKVPELRLIHFVCPVVTIVIFSAAVSVVPTVGFIWNGYGNATGLCEEADVRYGYYFLLYMNFHEIVWLFLIPIVALQAIYLYSLSKFGCKAQDITQRIEDNEDVEFAEVLDAETHWLLTVKWLVIIFTIVFLPVFTTKLIVTLLNGGVVSAFTVPNSIEIFINRFTMVFKGLVSLLSPLALLLRLSVKKREPIILETNL